jgi:nucleotide-binding universal stress UspA family protein
MNKRILMGIDAPISPATQHALRSMSEFIEQAAPLVRIVLLHVIPIPYFSSPALGMSTGHMQSTFFTSEQRSLAEEALQNASAELLKQGIDSRQIETLIYTGVPADQITKAAVELHVDFIVLVVVEVLQSRSFAVFLLEAPRAVFYNSPIALS